MITNIFGHFHSLFVPFSFCEKQSWTASSLHQDLGEITLTMVLLHILPIVSVICFGVPYTWGIFQILAQCLVSKAFLKSIKVIVAGRLFAFTPSISLLSVSKCPTAVLPTLKPFWLVLRYLSSSGLIFCLWSPCLSFGYSGSQADVMIITSYAKITWFEISAPFRSASLEKSKPISSRLHRLSIQVECCLLHCYFLPPETWLFHASLNWKAQLRIGATFSSSSLMRGTGTTLRRFLKLYLCVTRSFCVYPFSWPWAAAFLPMMSFTNF